MRFWHKIWVRVMVIFRRQYFLPHQQTPRLKMSSIVSWLNYLILAAALWFRPTSIRWSVPLTRCWIYPSCFTSTMLLPMVSDVQLVGYIYIYIYIYIYMIFPLQSFFSFSSIFFFQFFSPLFFPAVYSLSFILVNVQLFILLSFLGPRGQKSMLVYAKFFIKNSVTF